MRVAEIFHSVQGEGRFLGIRSVFVRTTGCNLRCWFCDTPYTSWQPEGVTRDWHDVLPQVLAYDCEHVVVTGGEPLLQPDVVPFTQALAEQQRFVTIETAGTVYRPVHADLMSISPKLSNSTPSSQRSTKWSARHESIRESKEVVAKLLQSYACQLKFVVDKPADLREILAYLHDLPQVSADQVWLMPQAITREALAAQSQWVQPLAEEHGFHYAHRLHIELFGNTRGT